jgi:hypothetical protein
MAVTNDNTYSLSGDIWLLEDWQSLIELPNQRRIFQNEERVEEQ